MNKELKIYLIIGVVFTGIVGTIWHFLYEWSGQSPFIGAIAPVNESTWEHLKLLFFPMLLYNIAGALFFRNFLKGIFPASTIGLLAGLVTIPVFFYTYTGIIGSHCLVLDIACFIAGILAAFTVTAFFFRNLLFPQRLLWASILVSLFFLILFLAFTWYPPGWNLFRDPGV